MTSSVRTSTALSSRTFLPTDRDGNYDAYGRPAEVRLPDGLQPPSSTISRRRAPGCACWWR